jgi:general secretion pathway protein D
VLQAPQLRAVDNQKASLKIGEREPTASGSFQPGVGGIGVNPLVNTQFTYLDVGVNVDMLARVHDNNEVSMNIVLEISNITGQVNLGGINEPVIGQRKVTCDLRMKEGEVGLLGGLINQEDDTTVTGIPGLSSIPLLGKLFSGNSVNHNRDELMIILIPHILRRPEITTENLRSIAVGNATVIQLQHAPKPQPVAPEAPPAAAPDENNAAAAAPKVATQPVATPPPPVAVVPAAPAGPMPPATAPPLPAGLAPPPTGGAAAAANQAALSAKLHFDRPAIDAAQGSPVIMSVLIDGGSDVSSAPMQIEYDSKVLRLNEAVAGTLLSADGQQPVFAKNIMNEKGQASIQLSRPPGAAGVTAPVGTLVTLTFQPVAPGRTTVSIPNLVVRNSQGAPVASGSPQVTVTVK